MRASLIWLLFVIVGFGLMFHAHRSARQVEQTAEWAGATLVVAEGELPDEADRLGQKATLRFLPADQQTKMLADFLGRTNSRLRRAAFCNWQEAAIVLPNSSKRFQQDDLQMGRLPRPGQKEVLAGHEARNKREVVLGNEKYQVVGVLPKAEALFSRAYLLADDAPQADLFDPADESVKQAVILSADGMKEIRDRLDDVFPNDRFTMVARSLRLEPGEYYLYLLGMLGLLAGGSALLIRGYGYWSQKTTSRWLAPPLVEIRQRRRLLGGLHVAYFGLVLLASALVYQSPDVQGLILLVLGDQLRSGQGLLAIVARAYESGNIAWAALATLGVNFVFGSVAVITLPSVIVPGVGLLMALFRATLWGILLAPSLVALSGGMLPHSFTLLLEGEAYILAAFFALLIPIDLFRPAVGPTVLSRYGRAVVLNVKANILVFLVLAIAAVYEAIEVIWQSAR